MMKKGTLSVIAGCMFSGKTRELIRQIRRLEVRYGEDAIQLFNHDIDNRYVQDHICGHDGTRVPAYAAHNVASIRLVIRSGTKVVAIDEGQFFEPARLEQLCIDLVKRGIDVIIAGLDTDFRWEPFGAMPNLMARADKLVKLDAVCTGSRECERAATRTQRLVNGCPAHWDDPVMFVGAAESYEARCPDHHIVLDKPDRK